MPNPTPTDFTPDEMARFWAKVDRGAPDECWEWRAGGHGNGYGKYYPTGKRGVLAHRFALWSVQAPESPRLHALHQCDNKSCVNPSHLHWGTHADNMREAAERGLSKPGRSISATCPHGHPMTPENIRIKPKKGPHGAVYATRVCRACDRRYADQRKARRRAASKENTHGE